MPEIVFESSLSSVTTVHCSWKSWVFLAQAPRSSLFCPARDKKINPFTLWPAHFTGALSTCTNRRREATAYCEHWVGRR